MISEDPPHPFITGEMFLDAEMAAILSDRAWLQAMLDFEAALAQCQGEIGVIPQSAAGTIAKACNAALYDMSEIGRLATLAGNPGGAVIKVLTAEVARRHAEAAEFVHYGATSQDVIDSGLAVIFERAHEVIRARAADLCLALSELTEAHRATPMAGRTVMQQALPMPFGLKTANWLAAVLDACELLEGGVPRRLQFGGAVGTLAALGDKGLEVEQRLFKPSGKQPGRGWRADVEPHHTNRSGMLRFASALGILTACLGKIARDVTLLMQTEVAEAFEPSADGKGGSSTMPHKRNPVQSLAVLACAARTPGLVATMLNSAIQEHERAAGGWQAEWDTMRQLIGLTGAACLHAKTMALNLEVDASRMSANLELTGGLMMAERVVFALAPTLGKAKAKALLEAACKDALASKRHLRDVLASMPEAAGLDLDSLFDPTTYFGASDEFIDRILKRNSDSRDVTP